MSKKHWLKAALAAGVAVLMGTTGAAAAQADPGVSPATGDLVIHKYIGAPIPNQDRDGTLLDTSGWTSVIPANGVVFDLYKVGAPLVPTTGGPWPDVPAPGKYVLNGTTLEVYDSTALIGEYALVAASPAAVTTGPNGTATAADLPKGLYLVMENVAASTTITNALTGEAMFISQAAVPFIVAVPMTNAAGDGWLDTVHVYPKNSALSVDKVVESSRAVAVGDTVSYSITASVPGDIATSKLFNIVDKLDKALDLDLATVAVTTFPVLTGTNALVKNLDYTITYDMGGHAFTVAFLDPGRVKLAGTQSVIVTFDTTINASILDSADGMVRNTGEVDFTNQDNTEFHAESDPGDPSTVHLAIITVTKVDQAGSALNGATFKIATSQANAEAGNFLRLDPVTQILYDYDAAAGSTWATLGATADYAVSPANTGSFVGLRDTVDVNGTPVWQTYWIVETTAPAGYNMLHDAIPVNFEDAFKAFQDPAEYDFTATLTVSNSKGFLLPETGGAGTILLTVAGVALIGAAVLIGVTRRRDKATN